MLACNRGNVHRLCGGMLPRPHHCTQERITASHTHTAHSARSLVIDDSNLSLTFSVKEVESQWSGVGVLKQETQDGY